MNIPLMQWWPCFEALKGSGIMSLQLQLLQKKDNLFGILKKVIYEEGLLEIFEMNWIGNSLLIKVMICLLSSTSKLNDIEFSSPFLSLR